MSAELLKKSVLFKDFTPTGLNILGRIARTRVVLAGKPLFTEGAAGDALYIILEGRFRVLMKGSDGKDLPIAALGPGEHASEVSLLGDSPPNHLCSAIAEADSKVVEIRRADFQQTMKEKPQACIKLMLAISQEFGRKVAATQDTLRHLLTRAAGR
ncbi:MAG: cyclic nucleotide-binding domain-containing protein [Myxococcales bacterium]